MMWMRGDMGGGAVVIATIRALALFKIPVNVVGLVPLTENMLGGSATKVMDVVRAKNGKTIEVSNTDAEGRLVLADALAYAEKFNPKLIVDVATLTGRRERKKEKSLL
jgi:leucyl aminopeptidase